MTNNITNKKDNKKRINEIKKIFCKLKDDFFLFNEVEEFVFKFEDNILLDKSSLYLSSIFIIF
jgi:hypothetical protein